MNMNTVTPLSAATLLVGRVSVAVDSEHDSLVAQRCMSKTVVQAMHDAQLSVDEFVLLSTKISVYDQSKDAEQLLQVSGTIDFLSRKGAVTHELRLPASVSKVRNVFYLSLLKRYRLVLKAGYRGSAPTVDGVPYVVLNDGEIDCEIDRRTGCVHHDFGPEYDVVCIVAAHSAFHIRQCVITLKFSYVLVLVSNTRAWSQNAAKAPSLFMW